MKKLILRLAFVSLFVSTHCQDCYLSCQGIRVTADMALCYENCDQKYTVLYACIALTIFLFLICGYCCCIRTQFICRKWRQRQLRIQYNKEGPALTPEQLNQKKEFFVRTARKSNIFPNFLLRKKSTQVTLRVSALRTKKVTNLLHSIEIEGSNDHGNWKAEGSMLSGEKGLNIWFLLEHQSSEIERAKQIGKKILLEGSIDGLYGFKGTWKSYEQEISQKGEWILIAQQMNLAGEMVEMESMDDIK